MVGCLVKKDQSEESRELNSKFEKITKSVIFVRSFFIAYFIIAIFVFQKNYFNEII